MKLMLAIAAGGAIGSVLRYLLGALVHRAMPVLFPLGTLVVNVVGCLAVGFAYVWMVERYGVSVESRSFVIVGILGGFTTFSAFSLDVALLFDRARLGATVSYLLGSVGLSIAALFLGLAIVRRLI